MSSKLCSLSAKRHKASLACFALSALSDVRKAEMAALDTQQEVIKVKHQLLHQQKLMAAQHDDAYTLTYTDMYDSPACW